MDRQLDEIWGSMLTYGIASDDEIKLVTFINGYTIDVLNDIIYARIGYRSIY